MKITTNIRDVEKDIATSILTIGTFDGMHLGHACLIKKLVEISKNNHTQSAVITFTPNPYTVINNIEMGSYHIISKNEKYKLLKSLGIDITSAAAAILELLQNLVLGQSLVGFCNNFEIVAKFGYDIRTPIFGFSVNWILAS